MNNTITYDLRNRSGNSDKYYEKIKLFADEILCHFENENGDIISAYKNYLQNNTDEFFRSRGEYIVEFLTLGMTWKRYLGAAQANSKLLLYLLKGLYRLRRANSTVKPYVDILRGWITGYAIAPVIGVESQRNFFTIENFNRLILWLASFGWIFKDEAKRLNNLAELLQDLFLMP